MKRRARFGSFLKCNNLVSPTCDDVHDVTVIRGRDTISVLWGNVDDGVLCEVKNGENSVALSKYNWIISYEKINSYAVRKRHHANKHFSELAPHHGGKRAGVDVEWRNDVTVDPRIWHSRGKKREAVVCANRRVTNSSDCSGNYSSSHYSAEQLKKSSLEVAPTDHHFLTYLSTRSNSDLLFCKPCVCLIVTCMHRQKYISFVIFSCNRLMHVTLPYGPHHRTDL